MIALIVIGVFAVAVMMGVPIAVTIGVTGIAGFLASGESLGQIGSLVTKAMDQELLIAIPFYVLAGLLLARSNIITPLLDLCMLVLRRIRGGMIGVASVSSVMFGGMTGSGPAEAASLAAILSPPMEKQGYPRHFSASLAAAGGTLGLVLPPSGGYILYSLISRNASISDLFIAAIVPGLLLAACYAFAAYIYGVRFEKRELRDAGPDGSLRSAARLIPGALLGLASPVVILGGIYLGITTVTEAAAIAVLYAIVVGVLVNRTIGLKEVWSTIVETGVATGIIMLVLSSAAILSWLVSVSGWAVQISDVMTGLASTPLAYLFLVAVIFLIAGTVIDGVSMYFILLPLVVPGAMTLGVDPVHLGIVITVAISIGLITPPLGLDLFAAASVVGVRFEDMARSVMPLIVAALLGLIVIILVPELSTMMLR